MTEHYKAGVERRRSVDTEIALLGQQIEHIETEVQDLRECKAKSNASMEGKLDELTTQLNKIERQLNEQRTFVGGVVWTATAILSFVAFALTYFKH